MSNQFGSWGAMPLGVTAVDAVIAMIAAMAGDGLDSDVTVNSPFAMSTGARDRYYGTLTINSTFDARAWRLYGRKLIVGATGVLHWDGLDAVGSAAGAQFTTGSLGLNGAGAAGNTGVGAASAAQNLGMMPGTGVMDGTIFRGGTGGLSGTGNAGGVGGVPGAPSSGRTARSNPLTGMMASGQAVSTPVSGTGGGAGGGDGTFAGGGGGSSAGFGWAMFGEIIVLPGGIIRARGGKGGNAAGGNAAGGAGGSGGPLQLVFGRYTGAAPDVSGGAGGNGSGTGAAGGQGFPGYYYPVTFKP